MMKRLVLLQMVLIFALPAFVPSTAAADSVYRQVDKEGRVIYTDQPSAEAEPVDLPPANTTPSVTPSAPEAAPERTESDAYRSIDIREPGSIVPNGLAGATVIVDLEPELQQGHRLQVLLDGDVIASGNQSSVILQRLPRGSHTLEVRILSRQQVLIAAQRDIFVYWPGGNR